MHSFLGFSPGPQDVQAVKRVCDHFLVPGMIAVLLCNSLQFLGPTRLRLAVGQTEAVRDTIVYIFDMAYGIKVKKLAALHIDVPESLGTLTSIFPGLSVSGSSSAHSTARWAKVCQWSEEV